MGRETPQALIISSNPSRKRTQDQYYPYRANSDLFYFSGIIHPDLSLVIRNFAEPKAVLVAPYPDPVKQLWEGASAPIGQLAKKAGIQIERSKNHSFSVKKLISGAQHTFTQSINGTLSNSLRDELSRLSQDKFDKLPHTFTDLEVFTSKLRLYKDPSEVLAILDSARITADALYAVASRMQSGVSEREVASFIDYIYKVSGGEPAFSTIVATGSSAATLHYHALNKTIKSGDLVLIDSGAEVDLYAADISRTLPIQDSKMAPDKRKIQRRLYDAVLSAQRAAKKKVRAGVLVRDIYLAAATELTRGLVDVGVLRGGIPALMKREAYKPYFPHGIGHSLGLDVHDVGPMRGNNGFSLEAGMVITIEPGLYFSKPVGRVKQLGIRIEDDLLVTSNGCTDLTGALFPSNYDALLELTSS